MRRIGTLLTTMLIATGCAGDPSTVEVQQRSAASTNPPTTISPSTTTTTSTSTTTTTSTSTTTTTTTTVPFALESSVVEALFDEVVAASDAPPVTCSPLADPDALIALEPLWVVGDRRDLDIRQRVEDTAERFLSDSYSPSTATVEVTASDGRGAAFEYSAGVQSLDTLGLPDELLEQADEVVALAEQSRIAYDIDSFGVFLGVSNPGEVRTNLAAMIALLTEIDPVSFPPGELDGFIESLTDDEISQLTTDVIQAFHILDGFVLSVDEPIVYEEQIPTADGFLTSLTTVKVIDQVDPDGCVRIEMRIQPEDDGLDEVIGGAVDDLVGDEAAEFDFDGVQVEEIVTGQFDVSTGRVMRLMSVARIAIDGDVRVETALITDVT